MAVFGCKKRVFGRPNQKTETTFCRQLYPKMVDETLVSYEYHYWVSFGQILKMAYFRLIFGRFPLIKSQNQNPMVLSVNFWDKTLIFGVWFPYIQRQLDLSGQITKRNFAFEEHPRVDLTQWFAKTWMSRMRMFFQTFLKHEPWVTKSERYIAQSSETLSKLWNFLVGCRKFKHFFSISENFSFVEDGGNRHSSKMLPLPCVGALHTFG